MRVAAEEESVQGEEAGAEDEDEERGDQEDVGGGGGEFVGIGKEGQQRFPVGGDVSHDQIHHQNQRVEAREQAQHEQDATKEFDARNEHGHLPRQGQIEAGEKVSDLLQVVKLAPAALNELPAPVEADEEKERRLERTGGADAPGVEAADLSEEGIHLVMLPVKIENRNREIVRSEQECNRLLKKERWGKVPHSADAVRNDHSASFSATC